MGVVTGLGEVLRGQRHYYVKTVLLHAMRSHPCLRKVAKQIFIG